MSKKKVKKHRGGQHPQRHSNQEDPTPVLGSDRINPPTNHCAHYKQQNPSRGTKVTKIQILDIVEKVATILGVFVGLVGLYWLVVSVKNDTKALQVDQRAWVGIEKMKLINDATENGFKIDLYPAQTGQTPAVRAVLSCQPFLSAVIPQEPNWEEFRKRKPSVIYESMLMPNTTLVWPCDGTGFGGDTADIAATFNAYRNKTAWLYVWIYVTYEDIFKAPHWVKVCRKHTFGDEPTEWESCPRGNDTDRSN